MQNHDGCSGCKYGDWDADGATCRITGRLMGDRGVGCTIRKPDSITFTVSGEPQGKERPRVTRNGTFTPRKTAEYERRVRAAYREQCGDSFLGDSALIVTIAAHFQPPKSVSRKKRAAMLAGLIQPKRKPDADNIAKAVCDALNGIAYRDDAQITCLIVEKQYSECAHVTVHIESREAIA